MDVLFKMGEDEHFFLLLDLWFFIKTMGSGVDTCYGAVRDDDS